MRFLATLLALPCVAALAAQSTTDAIHYRLEIEPNFTNQTIAARNTATFRALVANLTTIDLDLTSVLTVSAVTLGGNPLSFTRPTNLVRVTLDRAYQPNEQFTIAIDYAGAPPPSQSFGGFVFTTHAGSPMAWTLSEPFDAKLWWPGKDQLGDKSTFEMWVTHPDTMSAVSNGTLQGIDTLTGNRLRTRWATSYPMAAYLAAMSVTNYQRRTDTYTGFGASMPVEFYVFPESFASWVTGMDRVVPMLNAFSGAYGQYPFVNEKYGISQFTFGGGMEHQTISGQNSVSESLTAHELAHQWWGDMITCATWHDIWLNEGFATFSEALWLERKAGGTLAAYLAGMVARKPTSTSGTVYVNDISTVNSIFNSTNVYRKGSWVVHMLRGMLGDTTFFQGLANYRAAFAGSSATTADLRNVLEQTSGRDLGVFFDQWVMNGGSPAYNYAWRARNVGGVDYVYLEVDQTQTSRPVFVMPVPMRVTTASGATTQSVQNDERNDQMVIRLTSGPATAVALDPDQWILRGTPTTRAFTQPFFAAYPERLDVVAGGDVEFHGDRGATAANRPYLVVLGITGSTPGTNVFGLQVPVNLDALTQVSLGALNTPTFANFFGNLDAQGQLLATLRLPPNSALSARGASLTAAFIQTDSFDFASRPVRVDLR